jgi:hypothetical protein
VAFIFGSGIIFNKSAPVEHDQLNMTRWCLSCLFFKKFKKVPKTRAMQDLSIPSWHNFLEIVKHQAGNPSVFAGHVTKCENLLGGVSPQERCVAFWNVLHCLFFPVFPSYSTCRSARYHKTNWKYKISCQWASHRVSPWKQGFPTHASLRSTSGVLIFGMLSYPTGNSKRNLTTCRYGRISLWCSTYYVTKRPQLLNLAMTKQTHLQDPL